MNQLLTDEEILVVFKAAYHQHHVQSLREAPSWKEFTRSIEAAILSKLNSAVPFAWKGHSGHLVYDKKSLLPSTREFAVPLYLHPPAPIAVERRLSSMLDAVSKTCQEAESKYLALTVERDALKAALEKLACLGNGDSYGNSVGNCIAQEALKGFK